MKYPLYTLGFLFFICLFSMAFISTTESEYEYLPIVHFDKQPIIEGKLNGTTVYFMLDSGSELSLLNSSQSDSLGFWVSKLGPDNRALNGIGGEGKSIKYSSKHEIKLGNQQIGSTFYAYDLDHLFHAKSPYQPIGIIGGKTMREYSFQIDFKNKQIRIRNFNQK